MVALCATIIVLIPSCSKDISTPSELSEDLISHTETSKNADQSKDVSKKTEESSKVENNETDNSDGKKQDLNTITEKQEQEINATSEENKSVALETDQKTKKGNLNSAQNQNSILEQPSNNQPVYPISEETKTYIDIFGIQTIEKTYIIPYYADIREIAPSTITTNYVQYAVDSIVNPQNYEEKKLTKEIIAKTEDDADNFPTELEYDNTDGKGILTLDTSSIKVELNKNEKIPSGTSFVKT